MMIAATALVALAALASQDMPQAYGQYDQPGVTMQPPAPQAQAPDPTKRQIRDMARQVEESGALYETFGRCAGSMTPSEVERLLTPLQDAGAAGSYLQGRFADGFRRPKDERWCDRAIGRAARR